MKKRGAVTLPWLYLIEIVAGIFVALFLIRAGIDFAASQSADKDFLAKDLAMQLNSIYAMPGNAYLINTEGVSQFSFQIKDEIVHVFEEDDILSARNYNYVGTEGSSIRADLERPEGIIIAKKGNEVNVQQFIPNLISIECPDIDTQDSDWQDKIIAIDPGRDNQNPGLIFDATTEAEVMAKLSESLRALNENFVLSRNIDSDETASIDERIESTKDSEIVISFYVGSHDNSANSAKAFVNFYSDKRKESVKLACTILNSLAERNHLDAISIVPVDLDTLSEDDEKRILQGDNVAVFFEIGNMQTDKGKEMMKDLRNVPGQIFLGLKKYHEE